MLQVLKEADEKFDRYYELKQLGYNLQIIEERVCKIFDISVGEIYSKSREKAKAEARGLFCYWVVRELGYSMLEMAGRLGMSQPGVVYAVRRGERIANERGIKLTHRFNYFLSLVPLSLLERYWFRSSCMKGNFLS